jgi:anthranilate phosphoribosyltransferase
VLDQLGIEAGLTGHGDLGGGRGIDELTTATPNRVRGAGRVREIDGWWQPQDFGFVPGTFDGLRGGDVVENLAIVDAILAGRAPSVLIDTLLLNAATALWLMRKVPSVQDGVELARDHLLGGAVRTKIAATREFYAA